MEHCQKEKKGKKTQSRGGHNAQRKRNKLQQSTSGFPTLRIIKGQAVQRKDFVESCKRQIKPLSHRCTSNHLHCFTPFHFWQNPPLASKTFWLYCQMSMYYSCNFPNLLSVCEQKECICSKHIRNKEDNCFAKFPPSPSVFLLTHHSYKWAKASECHLERKRSLRTETIYYSEIPNSWCKQFHWYKLLKAQACKPWR